MGRLPASPSRTQALIEFEPLLLHRFQSLARAIPSEIRDTMHYALFSTQDRFCISAAWLVAPRVGVSTERLSPAACAIETLRCALAFKLRLNGNDRLFEPAVVEAASYGLFHLAFQMVLSPEQSLLSDREQCSLASNIAKFASPMHMLLATHHESQFAHDTRSSLRTFTRDDLGRLQLEKVTPSFDTVGAALALLAPPSQLPEHRAVDLQTWFRKLGLFAQWMDEFGSNGWSPLTRERILTTAEAMDIVKSLEAELLDTSRALGIRDAAHELIEPLADMLKARLQ